MTLQQWAEAHQLETAKVVSAVKKLIAEGKLDEETAQMPSAEVDDRADRALQLHFQIGQEPRATSSPAPITNAESGAATTVGTNGSEKPYVFTGEDPSRPGETLVERLVPVKLFAVARGTDSLAMFLYGMDEADAIGQYVAIKNLGAQSHRHRFKCEWCDAPQIHLATRMKNDGSPLGPNGYYHIVDTCETKKETRTVTDAQGREQTQQFWVGAQLLPWTKASYETESRRFLPNACLNWNREVYQFELTASAA